MNEFKVGDKIKYEVCISDNSTKWVYGTIHNITSCEEAVNEDNYEIILDDGTIEYLSEDDFQHMFEENIEEDVDCLLNTMSNNLDVDKVLSCLTEDEELKESFREALKEALTKVDDSRKTRPIKVNPYGTKDILEVKKVEIEGDYGAFDVWYTCQLPSTKVEGM